MFNFLQTPFLWILPLKALPNIYHVPFLAVPLLLQAVSSLLSCVSPSSPSSILSCSSYLSVAASPVCCSCWVTPFAPGTTASSWLSEAGLQFIQHHLFCSFGSSLSPSWSEHWVWRISAGAPKLSMSHKFFLLVRKQQKTKKKGKAVKKQKRCFQVRFEKR